MSRFSGSQGKGAMRSLREVKRAEAKGRNASTPPDKTRAYRKLLRELEGAEA